MAEKINYGPSKPNDAMNLNEFLSVKLKHNRQN